MLEYIGMVAEMESFVHGFELGFGLPFSLDKNSKRDGNN